MASGGAMKGSIARGCSSLQGGGSNSGNMARWRQINRQFRNEVGFD